MEEWDRQPCPYCGQAGSYRVPTSREAADYLARQVAHIMRHPLLTIFNVVTGEQTGSWTICRACGKKVVICPRCDAVQQGEFAAEHCRNCGTLVGPSTAIRHARGTS